MHTKACPSSSVSQPLRWVSAPRDVQLPSLQSCVHGPETALSGLLAHAFGQKGLMSIIFPPFPWQLLGVGCRGGSLPPPTPRRKFKRLGEISPERARIPLSTGTMFKNKRESLASYRSRTPATRSQLLWLLRPWETPAFLHRFAPSSWATRFSKIQKIQEGQGEKQQPLNRVQGWMRPGSQRARQGKQAVRLTQQAANSPTRRRSGPPAGSCASSLPKWPALTPEKVGTQQDAQATSGHPLSGLFCLPNSSAVSEPKANPNLSPRTPSQSKPRRCLPVPAVQTPALACTHTLHTSLKSELRRADGDRPAVLRSGRRVPRWAEDRTPQAAFSSALAASRRRQLEASSKTKQHKKDDSGRWRPREVGNSRWGRCGVEGGRERGKAGKLQGTSVRWAGWAGTPAPPSRAQGTRGAPPAPCFFPSGTGPQIGLREGGEDLGKRRPGASRPVCPRREAPFLPPTPTPPHPTLAIANASPPELPVTLLS